MRDRPLPFFITATIFSTVDGGFGITSPSSVVNATASSPGVRLRIVTDSGDDISGTRLGEKLFLRIELEAGTQVSCDWPSRGGAHL